jgi:hypothetical protein
MLNALSSMLEAYSSQLFKSVSKLSSKRYFRPKINIMKTEHRWGITIGLLNFIWLMTEYVTGLHGKHVNHYATVTNFALLIPLVCTSIALYQIKKVDFKGTISFMEAFKPGVVIATIAAFISAFGVFVYFQINPGFTDFMVDIAKLKALKSGEPIAKAADLAKMLYSVNSYVIQSFISAIGFGIVLAALIALIIKNKK